MSQSRIIHPGNIRLGTERAGVKKRETEYGGPKPEVSPFQKLGYSSVDKFIDDVRGR
jgi:hypothetical protein